MEWVVNKAYSSSPPAPLITGCKSDGGVRELLQSLIALHRKYTFNSPHSLHSSLTARGSVITNILAVQRHNCFLLRLFPKTCGMSPFAVVRPPVTGPGLLVPMRPEAVSRSKYRPHLVLICSFHFHQFRTTAPRRALRARLRHFSGYFLTAGIDFGVSVPDVFDTWLAQASSVMTHPSLRGCQVGDFFVPHETRLELFWEMVVVGDDSSILAELPDTIHVFIRPPVLSDGDVEEPEIFWSTNVPPVALKIRTYWTIFTTGVSWAAHHYEVAEKIQEEAGFDPKTTAAAESLGLPILKTQFDKSPIASMFFSECPPPHRGRFRNLKYMVQRASLPGSTRMDFTITFLFAGTKRRFLYFPLRGI
ncbi:hypothetical protein C8R46DRAFT_1035014 [Mycena filopes]|nr:hypothetical protein C8R46DRAFT_1035014 [Mycena filopes]